MNEGGCDRTGEILAKALPVEHSPHCCRSRLCHDVCSHACGTDLEAIPSCRCSPYCVERQPIVEARIAERRRREERTEAPAPVELYGQRIGDEA